MQTLYFQSWIGQYFNYKVQADDDNNQNDKDENIVVFKKLNGELITNNRFSIFMHIPENTQKYFLPDSEWKTKYKELSTMEFIPVDILSFEKNGFPTKPYPYSQSQIYVPPFFILFKSDHAIQPNYLEFNNFFHPNTDACILTMLNYNSENDMFNKIFSLGINLPYLNSLALNNVLEFILVDSHKKRVDVANRSQLYISLKIVKNKQ